MPTPRTDSIAQPADEFFDVGYHSDEPAVPASFARTLERENASLVARCARLEKALAPFVTAFEQRMKTRSSARCNWNEKMPDTFRLDLWQVSMGDCREARAALQGAK